MSEKADVLETAQRALLRQGDDVLFDDCGGLAFVQVRLVSDLSAELAAARTRIERMEVAIRQVLSHFESHQVYDKGSERILREALEGDDKK